MPEKDDFDSWDPQDMEEELQQPDSVDQQLRQHMDESEPAKPAARRRQMLLLLLLLVLGGAAAYLYLGVTPEPEAPQVVAPVRKPIALPPPPPADEAIVKTETIPAAPAAVDASNQPAAPGAVPEKADAAAASKAVAEKAGEKIARPESTPQKTAVEPVPAPATSAAAEGGQYALQAGAFLLKSNLRAAEATVRRLGYEPQVQTVRRNLPMTRLRVGGFFAKEGEAKLASIKPIAPDAFLVRQGDFVLVYAGTYQDLDRARRVADQLYQQGVRVEEEPTTAEVSLSLLSFGNFADRDQAAQAAVKAKAAGLEAVVRKTP